MCTQSVPRVGLTDAENLAQDIPASLQHVVVICDGTPGGDKALHLANAISQSTGASVQAVTWLPVGYALDGDAPIENFLASVTQQLYRVTTMVGFWRLELLTGYVDQQLAQLCSQEAAALLIIPSRSAESLAPRWTLMTGIPVACVAGKTALCGEQVILCTRADAKSQHHAHFMAAIVTAAHTMSMACRTSPDRYTKRPCPYVQVQTVPMVPAYFAGAHSSSNNLSLTAS